MKIPFYVVLTGVHGSGKSTVLKKFETIESYKVFPETSDIILTDPTSQPPFQRQHWFLNNLEKREEEIKKTNEIFVCDRWVGDVIRYSKVLYELNCLSFGEYQNLLARYHLKDWKMPDLEFVFTASRENLEERIMKRDRAKTQKEEELKLAKAITTEFENYVKGHKFNRKIVLFDTSEKSTSETFQEVKSLLNEYIECLVNGN